MFPRQISSMPNADSGPDHMETFVHDSYMHPISIMLMLTTLILWFYLRKVRKRLPPGPFHIPFIGNSWKLTADPDMRKSLRQLHKQYGDIYRLYMGPKLVVIISGFEMIKEVFVKRGAEFSDRPDFLINLIGENQGIASSSGKVWTKLRKFTLTTLRSFGFGKTSLEGKIHTEVSMFLSKIEQENQNPFCIKDIVKPRVSNVINVMAFGEHFKREDPTFTKMMRMLDENTGSSGPSPVLIFFPFLRHLPGDLFRAKKVFRNVQFVEGFIGELINKHIENFEENKIEDFIDAFLLQIKTNREQKDFTFTHKQLIKTLSDLFIAGMDTTTTTITWAVLYLAAKPDIQRRVFCEVDEAVGTERLPSLQDRRNLVYTEAFIMEIQRICNVATVSLPHTCSVDTKIGDFEIPKDTPLIPDTDSVLFDPKIWGDPEEFRPERFISKEGTLLKPEEFIPFFTGRRNCVGEPLARMELSLFIPALVQNFEILPPEGMTFCIKETDNVVGLTHRPKPFEIRAIPRTK